MPLEIVPTAVPATGSGSAPPNVIPPGRSIEASTPDCGNVSSVESNITNQAVHDENLHERNRNSKILFRCRF